MDRVYATKQESFQSCEHPACSFFDLIDSIWRGNEERSYPLHRFCTLMRKMNAQSYICEELVLNEELSKEKGMAEEYFEAEIGFDAFRLTFFCTPDRFLNWGKPDEFFTKHILGYAVIATMVLPDNTCNTYLFEAIVRSPSIVFFNEDEVDSLFIEGVTNYYIHNARQFKTGIGPGRPSKSITIRGSFFCQQNGITGCCAHAALRMAINSSPLLDAPKLTDKCINDILRAKLGVGVKDLCGLNQRQIQTVVEELGYGFHSANFLENTHTEYDQFIYPSLESRFPQILGIQGWDPKKGQHIAHVVTVLGHTINSDRWTPEARCGYGNYPIPPYISSASWCDHFIISDDNYGMYVTLPTESLRNLIVPTKNPNLHVTMGISVMLKEIRLQGYDAEQRAMVVADKLIRDVQLDPANVWLNRMKTRDLVCRTLLQKKTEYIYFIRKHNNSMTSDQIACLDNLPDSIWVTEVSIPNVYAGNKRKLGDVIIRANATEAEHMDGTSVAMAWFPGFTFLGAGRKVDVWDIDTHVPLIRSVPPSFLEW